MSGGVFEAEVRRVAALEGINAPRVVVDVGVKGRAAASPSGRQVRVHPDVLTYPEPAQRWLAAHEMRHVLAHGWGEPGRWVGLAVPIAGFALLAVVVWSSLLPPQLVPVVALWGVACVGFLWQAGTAWWSRRIEAEADQYAAREGRLEALDEPSLLELLIGDPDTPAWRSTHPRWLDRIPVPSDRLPEGIRRMQAELDQAVARLDGEARPRRRRPPTLVMVHELPGGRVVVGRWRRVLVARAGFVTPVEMLRPQFAAAVVQARRLPRVRAVVAGGAAFCGVLAAVIAQIASAPGRAVQTAAGFATLLLLCGGYELYRRSADRRLLRRSHEACES